MSQPQNFGPPQPSQHPQSPQVPQPPYAGQPTQYAPGTPQPAGAPPYYYHLAPVAPPRKLPRIFPKWVGIVTLILGLANLISIGLTWQNVDGPTIKGQADAFTPGAQGVFPGVTLLIMSIFLITTAVLILRNKTPRFQRIAPIALIICGVIDIVMMILVLTFLNIKPYIKDRWGASALKETDHSFGFGIWVIVGLGLVLIVLGVLTRVMAKKSRAGQLESETPTNGGIPISMPPAGGNMGPNPGQGFNASPSSPQGPPRP